MPVWVIFLFSWKFKIDFFLIRKQKVRLYISIYCFSPAQSGSKWTFSTIDSQSSLYLRKFFFYCFFVITSDIYSFSLKLCCYSLVRLPGSFFCHFFCVFFFFFWCDFYVYIICLYFWTIWCTSFNRPLVQISGEYQIFK